MEDAHGLTLYITLYSQWQVAGDLYLDWLKIRLEKTLRPLFTRLRGCRLYPKKHGQKCKKSKDT